MRSMKMRKNLAGWVVAVGLSLYAAPAFAADIDKLPPDATGWVSPVVAILAILGIASISFKSSKRTHLD